MSNPATSPLYEFKQAAIINTLKKSPLFAGTSLNVLTEVAAFTTRKALAKGEYLFREGKVTEGFFIVQDGAIKLHRNNRTGKEQIIHIFRTDESFAEETLIPDLGYPADACATEPSHVLLVQKEPFVSLLKRQPDLALRMLRSMNKYLCLLVGLLDDLRLKDVKTRLANWLIQHCPDPQSTEPYSIRLPVSKRMLASELGVMSETFSRTLAKFRAQKLVTVEGKTVVLLSPARMTQFIRRNVERMPAPSLAHC